MHVHTHTTTTTMPRVQTFILVKGEGREFLLVLQMEKLSWSMDVSDECNSWCQNCPLKEKKKSAGGGAVGYRKKKKEQMGTYLH